MAGNFTWNKSYNGEEVVEMYSSAGCPKFSINPLYQFFPTYLLAFCILIIGFFSLIFGRKNILKTSIAINSFCFTFTGMLTFYNIFLRNSIEVKNWVNWLTFCIIFVLSSLGTYFMTQRWPKISINLIAFWSGIIIWVLLSTAI